MFQVVLLFVYLVRYALDQSEHCRYNKEGDIIYLRQMQKKRFKACQSKFKLTGDKHTNDVESGGHRWSDACVLVLISEL